jgi:uncharacterized membrane protein YfcA
MAPAADDSVTARRGTRRVAAAAHAEQDVRADRARAHENPTTGWVIFVFASQFIIAVYGGYFGAGMGILMLAALGLIGLTDLHQMNGLKNLLAICIAGVAAVYFSLSGAVSWHDAWTMMISGTLGGYLGARIARRLGRKFVRITVVIIGLVMTVALFVKQVS